MDIIEYTKQRHPFGRIISLVAREWSGFHAVAVAMLFIVIFGLFFYPILFSASLLASDGLIPADFKMQQWSTSIFSGFPLFGDPIWSAYYPLRVIMYKLIGLDFNYYIISGYFLMAYFTYGYVYLLTRLKIAAFISAMLFSFSGYALYEIGHAATFIHTICWLPFVLFSFEKLKNGSIWGIIGVILGISMTILGGFPQLSLALFPVFVSYAFLLGLKTEKKRKTISFYLMLISMGYLLVAPVIISTFVLSLFSDRAHLSWEMFASYYVELKQLLLFNFPYLMGGYYGLYAKIPAFGNWEIVGNHGYMGFLSLILAGIGLYKCHSCLRSYINYWLCFCLLSVIVALGPEIEFFYRFLFHIPVVNNFRAPERYLFLFSFGISIMAGIGIHSMRSGLINTIRTQRLTFLSALFFGGVLLISVIAVYPSLSMMSMEKAHVPLPPFYKNYSVTIPFLWIISSLLAMYFWLKKPVSLPRGNLALALLVGELLSTVYFSYWHPSHSIWTKKALATPPAYLNELRDDLNKSNQRYLTMQYTLEGVMRYLGGNYAMYYDLPSAGGYTSLSILRYLNFLQITNYGTYFPTGIATQLQENQAINIAGIKYLFTTNSDPLNKIWFKDTEHFRLKKEIGNVAVYENLKALPRVWFTSDLVTLSPHEVLQVILSGKFSNGDLFKPEKTALVEFPQNLHFESDKNAKAIIKKLGSNQVIISTQTDMPQFLVLSDIYFPGWQAYLDGKKTSSYLTDYVYRGVVIPAGTHTLTFKFIPIYLYIGYGISVLTLFGITLIVFPGFRRKILKLAQLPE